MSKQRFTDYYLSAMIRAATGGSVQRVRYSYLDLAKLEQATIIYDNGYTKTVDLTGDSLVGIAYDVLKAVM